MPKGVALRKGIYKVHPNPIIRGAIEKDIIPRFELLVDNM